MQRKCKLVKGQIYHIFSKSIAKFEIFNTKQDYRRMLYLLNYFQLKQPPEKFSNFFRLDKVSKQGFLPYFSQISKNKKKIIQIIAYCLMPTHIHLILKQLTQFGISKYISNVLNSYSRYFNIKYHRKGPLWEKRFQSILVNNDEQLLHLTRYLHLNPTSAHLINKPQNWEFSSYKEYLGRSSPTICQYDNLLEIKPEDYKNFVQDRTAYQRELAKIKKIIFDQTSI
jgi:putative transposase